MRFGLTSRRLAEERAFRERLKAAREQAVIQRRLREELEASQDDAPRSSWWRILRRLVFRGRRILAPIVLLAVLWVAGFAAEMPAVAAGAVPGVWVLTSAGWWAVRGRRVKRTRERVYAGACIAGGAVWLVCASLLGVGVVDGWLVTGWAAAAAPWWVRHWPRDREPEQAEVVEPEAPREPVIALWRENVAAATRALPGAELSSPRITEHGEAYRVQAVPGAAGQQLDGILGKLPQIAQGLRTPQERIVIDQDPDEEDPSVFRLQVIHQSPIKETVWFDQPRWEAGSVLLGPYADGIDDAVWRLYTPNSMWGGYLLGGTGSGKTAVLSMIGLSARAMSAAGQPTVLVYLDGQDGASSPVLWKHATWRGGPDEAAGILAALESALRIRQRWNRLHGLSGFTPGASPDGAEPGLPGILVVVDECHQIFHPDTALRWAEIARGGRKVGMALIGASQVGDLSAFGHQEALRSSLLAGNALALRTATKNGGNSIPGLSLDPATFPVLAGYGYKIAAPGSGERTAPFRARFLPDAKDRKQIPDLPVPIVEEWFDRTADAEVDAMTARAFGPAFLRRHELAAQATEAARAEIAGRTPPSPVGADPAGETRARPAAVEDEPEEVNGTTRELILAALADGPLRPVELEGKTGKSKSSVKQALRRLMEDGQIQRGSGSRDPYSLVREAVPAA